jgi:hypothetical protein
VKVKPNQVFWLTVCAAVVSLPLFLLLRSTLTPSLLSIAEFVWRLYRALPPAVLWLGLLIVLYLMAATGWLALSFTGFFGESGRAPGPTSFGPAESAGRVAVLARWVRRRKRGLFSRHYLKQMVTEIGIEKLAQAHRVSPAQIKAALEAGALGLPPEVSAYLLVGLSPWPTESLGGWRELVGWLSLGHLTAPPGEDEIERVLEFLEGL